MGLGDDQKRKIRTICHLIEKKNLGSRYFTEMIRDIKPKDVEVHNILLKAHQKSVTKYDQIMEEQVMGQGIHTIGLSSFEDIGMEKFAKDARADLYSDDVFMKQVLRPEIDQVARDRDKELKGISNEIRRRGIGTKDQGMAFGVGQRIKKSMGIGM